MRLCPKCGKTFNEEVNFCDACGKKIIENTFCPYCGEKNSSDSIFCQKCGKNISQRANKSKKFIYSGIAIITLFAIILFIFTSLFDIGVKDYAFYIKDGEIVCSNDKKDSPFNLTVNFANNNDTDYYRNSGIIQQSITLNDDRSRIFFPDRTDDYTHMITLYYRDINKLDEGSIKVDSDISMYSINDEGTKIAYVKGETDTLYINDLNNKQKIASNVKWFVINDEFTTIVYYDYDEKCYIWHKGENVIAIDDNIESIEYISRDMSQIYYIKNDNLYKQTENSEDTEKISSDVYEVIKIYNSGEMYYTKVSASNSGHLYDDEKMQYTLYYYDGKNETVIIDGLNEECFIRYAEDKPVITFDNQSNKDCILYICNGAKLSIVNTIKYSDNNTLIISDDGNTVYFTDEVSDDNYGNLYKIKISNSNFGNPEIYDNDIYNSYITLTQNNDIFYYKNVNDDYDIGDLYVNGNELDYDVCFNSVAVTYGGIYELEHYYTLYYTDWDYENKSGTLKMYNNGESIKIADNVHDFGLTLDCDLVYLNDYDIDNYYGSLYKYNNNNPEKIDDDVTQLISVLNNELIDKYLYGLNGPNNGRSQGGSGAVPV